MFIPVAIVAAVMIIGGVSSAVVVEPEPVEVEVSNYFVE